MRLPPHCGRKQMGKTTRRAKALLITEKKKKIKEKRQAHLVPTAHCPASSPSHLVSSSTSAFVETGMVVVVVMARMVVAAAVVVAIVVCRCQLQLQLLLPLLRRRLVVVSWVALGPRKQACRSFSRVVEGP